QSSNDDFSNCASAILRAEEVSCGRREALCIRVAVFLRRQRLPDFRWNVQPRWIQRAECQLQRFFLAFSGPDDDRLLSIAGERERYLGASHHTDRGSQRIAM